MAETSNKIGVDTTWLVCLGAIEHPGHELASSQLQRLQSQNSRFILTPLVIAEFLHVVTDSRRFAQPRSMLDALDFVNEWWTAEDVEQVFPTAESVQLALEWMRQFKLGRKRILDTQLAATLHSHGIDRLVTSNPADFAIFGVFDIVIADPTVEEQKE